MKKTLFSVIIFFSCILGVNAYDTGISNYYVNATIEPDGDLYVQEAFSLNGEYNGMERIIKYKNSDTKTFDGSLDSFNGSSIYNGYNIELIEVRGISGNLYNMSNYIFTKELGKKFKRNLNAQKGDYGFYTDKDIVDGKSIMIYNPSAYGDIFYVEYRIKNMAVVHEDVAEIGYNIFTDLRESVGHLEVIINIPGNEDLIKAWGHGSANGNVEILSKEKVRLTVDYLNAYEAIDTRIVFDKDVIEQSHKHTGVEALDKIMQAEVKRIEDAEEAYEKQQLKKLMLFCFQMIINFLIIIIHIIFYFKYLKPYKPNFKNKYFRDIPSDILPSCLTRLLGKSIDENSFSAEISNLICEKVITFTGSKESDIVLYYNNNNNKSITKSQEEIIELIFDNSKAKEENGIKSIQLTEFKRYTERQYNSVYLKYEKWLREIVNECNQYKFFEEKAYNLVLFNVILVLYIIVISIIDIYNYNTLALIISLIILIYIVAYNFAKKRRTKEATEEYAKWKALKNFMVDFGRMNEKDLPQIMLWEKYLVYAHVLGCADKLAKTMKLKIKDYNIVDSSSISTINNISNNIICQNIIASSIQRGAQRAYNSHYASNTSNTSGSGGSFSSGGGGSFGGGGGGGRF